MEKKRVKNPHAVALGRLAVRLEGGRARTLTMTPEQRREAARYTSQIRWSKEKMENR